MYDTRPPHPHTSKTILGDGSMKKGQVTGKIDLVFHSRTDVQVALYDMSILPDLGCDLFSFHVDKKQHKTTLNKTGAHLLDGRQVFPVGVVMARH